MWVKDLLMWGSSAAFKCLCRRDDGWGSLHDPSAKIWETSLESRQMERNHKHEVLWVGYLFAMRLPAGEVFVPNCQQIMNTEIGSRLATGLTTGVRFLTGSQSPVAFPWR